MQSKNKTNDHQIWQWVWSSTSLRCYPDRKKVSGDMYLPVFTTKTTNLFCFRCWLFYPLWYGTIPYCSTLMMHRRMQLVSHKEVRTCHSHFLFVSGTHGKRMRRGPRERAVCCAAACEHAVCCAAQCEHGACCTAQCKQTTLQIVYSHSAGCTMWARSLLRCSLWARSLLRCSLWAWSTVGCNLWAHERPAHSFAMGSRSKMNYINSEVKQK